MEIRVDDLEDPRIAAFLNEHLSDMKAISPPESKHALDLDALKAADITFWSVWDTGELLACGALKELDAVHGEIKSMRTSSRHRGRGVGTQLLQHILSVAQKRAYQRVSLETGSMAFFAPAHRLYARFGFSICAPFANYKLDPNSVFMCREF